jgi:geranylgeranyl pyrophosphate synthase
LGLGTSLFAGNILYSLALRAILESGFGVTEANEVVRFLASEYQDVNESQILDQLFEYQEIDPNEWEVMASKRAASLFKASLLTGAILASAPREEMRILENAAWHIGFAFDIQDDIIDTFTTKEQYGRAPCGDIFKGKKPFHIAIALQKSDRLAAIMQKRTVLSDDEVKEVQDVIRESGALQEAKDVSRDNARKAESLISSTRMGHDEKAFFVSFIRYVDESLEWYS